MSRSLRLTLLVALCAAVTVAAPAHVATAASSKYPTVTTVTPLKLGVGDTIQIRGKGFRSGKNKNTVLFRAEGGRSVFAKADKATTTKITMVVPAKLLPFMKTKDGARIPTRFQLRVVSAKLGKKYTTKARSPLISPSGTQAGASAAGNEDCDNDGAKNVDESDDDNDMLSDGLELQLHTDTCKADTDGDGVPDGYEYYSAVEFNSLALPYPGKRPYPNALDGTDANIDFDQDVLTLYEEYIAWTFTGKPFPLSYSDGNQWTGGKTPATGSWAPFDDNQDGTISDDEKDLDADGLNNYEETHGPLSSPDWWTAYTGGQPCGGTTTESKYPGVPYAGTNFADADTDGDGLVDGPDDVDHDGYTNGYESYRPGMVAIEPGNWCTDYVSTAHTGAPNPDPLARVQPFNPCKPIYSDFCHSHPPYGYYPSNEDWESPYHAPYP